MIVTAPEAWTTALLLGGRFDDSKVGRSFADSDRDRLRWALRSVASARDLERLVRDGHPALRAWRSVDRVALLSRAQAFLSRVEWALDPDRSLDDRPPEGVLLIDEVGPAGHEWADGSVASASLALEAGDHRVPRNFVSEVIRRDLAVAHRCRVVMGTELAVRWLQSAEARWWPPGEVRNALDAFAEMVELAHTPEELAALVIEIDSYCQSVMVHPRKATPRRIHRSWDVMTALRRADTKGRVRECIGMLHDAAAPGATERERSHVLDVLLLTPAQPWPVEAGSTPSALAGVARLLSRAAPRWRERAAVYVPTLLRSEDDVPDWLNEVDPGLSARVMACWPVPNPNRVWNDGRLRAYLDVLERAGSPGEQRADWLRQKWVAQIANSELAAGAFALLLLADRSELGVEQAVASLVAGFGAPPSLRRALRQWAHPAIPDNLEPQIVDRQADELDVPRSLLVRYLHYRSLAGDDARLPRSAERLLDSSRPDGQRTALVRRIETTADDVERARLIQVLATRDERDADLDAQQGRRRHALRRLRHQLERGMADYTLASLRLILTDHAGRTIGPSAGDIPMHLLGDVAWLACDENTDAATLRRFLTTTLRGDSVLAWPENQSWISTARRDVDIDAWLEGFDVRTTVGGSPVRFITDHDPWRALHMGSWFDTCLDLETGFNRTSALTNVIEANRHVVYGLDPSGTVVSRKLIAVTDDGAMIGYRTYAHEDRDAHDRAIGAACASLAARCRLALSNTGTPESLTGSFWYDDGVASWASLEEGSWEDPAYGDVMAELDEARSRHARSRLPLLLRDGVPDAAVDAGLTSQGWPFPYPDRVAVGNLVTALWFDGRLVDPVRLFDWAANRFDCGESVRRVPLIDPGALEQVARGWQGRPRYLPDLLIPSTEAAGNAALRINDSCGDEVFSLVEPSTAVSYLADVADHRPAAFTIRLLRRRGADPKRLRKAVVKMLRRRDATHLHAEYECAAASERWLRNHLDVPTLRCPAALELATRGAEVALAKISQLADQHPADLDLTAAVYILGGTAPNRVFSAEATSAARHAHLRLAVRRGLPADAIRRANPRVVAQLGHTDLPPDGPANQTTWQYARYLGPALLMANRGDWTALSAVIGADSLLVLDPEVESLIMRSLTGEAQELEGALSIAEALTRAELGFVTPVIPHTMATIALRSAEISLPMLQRSFTLAIKQRGMNHAASAALSTLSRAVGPTAIPALAGDDRAQKPSDSQWIIAAMLREGIHPPTPSSGKELFGLIDAIHATHTLPDAEDASHAVLAEVDDELLGNLATWCIHSPKPMSSVRSPNLVDCFSRTQLALLRALAARPSSTCAQRLADIEVSLRSRIELHGTSTDTSHRAAWLLERLREDAARDSGTWPMRRESGYGEAEAERSET